MIDISSIIKIARDAGIVIMDVYRSSNFEIELKSDNSPLTKADKASHALIKSQLQGLYPHIPILSEEGKEIPYATRKKWSHFWLVDPLDGTKEFIKRNGEFTVNIALVRNDRPVLGVIYAPDLDVLYYGQKDNGAFKTGTDGRIQQIQVRNLSNGIIAVQSRSHSSDAETQFYSRFHIINTISIGSSLKFCMVAEGKAHLYYRSGPTWEWDTAAGQAIVEAAGGRVLAGDEPLKYNKEVLTNPGFVVRG